MFATCSKSAPPVQQEMLAAYSVAFGYKWVSPLRISWQKWIPVSQQMGADTVSDDIACNFTFYPSEFAKCSWSWRQSFVIWESNLHCRSRDDTNWDPIDVTGSLSSCCIWQHSLEASRSSAQVWEISWSSLQFSSQGEDGCCGTGGTMKGCWSSWGILHLSLRSHARHFFMRSISQGFETGSYVISWLGSVITLNLAQKVL